MNTPYFYEICIEGHLAGGWSDWFEGLTIQHDTCQVTTLRGSFIDQAALLGILNKIHALNLTLISINRSAVHSQDAL
ncbi:MAG: hypothetical protein H6667_18415 [Ardenticatenaceae bacterium]|nr:hypothetical protein [Ardenticatenaceae bacterium]MCB9445754.1 hypothetical protein [Ardenticatenaceae bacterium]